MWASGYRYFKFEIFFVRTYAKVSVPIRPTNILSIMISFPLVLNKGVIPVDSPTVANADTSSNNISMILN